MGDEEREEGVEQLDLETAAYLVVREGAGSTSILQRQMSIGYDRAARIVKELERRGILGASRGAEPRAVLIKPGQLKERLDPEWRHTTQVQSDTRSHQEGTKPSSVSSTSGIPLAIAVAVCVIGLSFKMCAGNEQSTATLPPSSSVVEERAANSPSSTRRASAEEVMRNARALCRIEEEPPHLVVDCFEEIPQADRLRFARAIADADAVLSGKARNIYFYLPGGRKFAQADPLSGIRLTE